MLGGLTEHWKAVANRRAHRRLFSKIHEFVNKQWRFIVRRPHIRLCSNTWGGTNVIHGFVGWGMDGCAKAGFPSNASTLLAQHPSVVLFSSVFSYCWKGGQWRIEEVSGNSRCLYCMRKDSSKDMEYFQELPIRPKEVISTSRLRRDYLIDKGRA
jgi:hypothetical protein